MSWSFFANHHDLAAFSVELSTQGMLSAIGDFFQMELQRTESTNTVLIIWHDEAAVSQKVWKPVTVYFCS